MAEHLSFLGAAREVTGSLFLLESNGVRVLVDCGMHQGAKHCEEDNATLPLDPSSVRAVFVTHAHIDHTGRIPFLVSRGFKGSIYSTPATKELAEQLLADSASIIGEEAHKAQLPPLFTDSDVQRSLAQWKTVEYRQSTREAGFSAEFFDAGHILGSAFIRVTTPEKKRIVFSGDLGNSPVPLLRDPEPLPPADILVLESTYGGRTHDDPAKNHEHLEEILRDVVHRKSVLLIPAFSVQRTQTILYEMNDAVENRRVPAVPVFLDSPLASRVTDVYGKYEQYLDNEARRLSKFDNDLLDFPGLRSTPTSEESKEINGAPPPKIIIAGSGMSTGGRILHHEIRYLQDARNVILFVGYQAKGTRGRAILEGASEVEIFGEQIPVRIQRKEIAGYSAHADQPRLLAWVAPRAKDLESVFLVHGEEDQMKLLSRAMQKELGIKPSSPALGTRILV